MRRLGHYSQPIKRPFPVTMLAWLFIAVGFASTVDYLRQGPLYRWSLPIALVGIIAVLGGVFLLRGAGWARWLLLVWLAFHVVVSALNSPAECLPHLVLLMVVGYFLPGAPTSEYFKSSQTE
jgi:hypothetical protein